MALNTKIHDNFEGYSLSTCSCFVCSYFKGQERGCAVPECCCSEEKIKALMREFGLNHEASERFAAENRGVNYTEMRRRLAESS